MQQRSEGRRGNYWVGTVLVIALLGLAILLVFVPGSRAAVMDVLTWLARQGLAALKALWGVLAPVVGAVVLACVITLTVYLIAWRWRRPAGGVWPRFFSSLPLPVGIFVFLIALLATIPGVAGAGVSGSPGFAGGVLAALIALIGVLFSQSLNAYTAAITQWRELANTREGALQSRLYDIEELFGDREPNQTTLDDHEKAVARAKVRAALSRAPLSA